MRQGTGIQDARSGPGAPQGWFLRKPGGDSPVTCEQGIPVFLLSPVQALPPAVLLSLKSEEILLLVIKLHARVKRRDFYLPSCDVGLVLKDQCGVTSSLRGPNRWVQKGRIPFIREHSVQTTDFPHCSENDRSYSADLVSSILPLSRAPKDTRAILLRGPLLAAPCGASGLSLGRCPSTGPLPTGPLWLHGLFLGLNLAQRHMPFCFHFSFL